MEETRFGGFFYALFSGLRTAAYGRMQAVGHLIEFNSRFRTWAVCYRPEADC